MLAEVRKEPIRVFAIEYSENPAVAPYVNLELLVSNGSGIHQTVTPSTVDSIDFIAFGKSLSNAFSDPVPKPTLRTTLVRRAMTKMAAKSYHRKINW